MSKYEITLTYRGSLSFGKDCSYFAILLFQESGYAYQIATEMLLAFLNVHVMGCSSRVDIIY